jgi:hypothetical protein
MSIGELLRDLAGPGVVFLLLATWLVRKAWKAARTERELEHERELEEAAPPSPAQPLLKVLDERDGMRGADTTHARAEHVAHVAAQVQSPAQVVWVRSLGANVAWLERLPGGEHALRVARPETGETWRFQ